MLGCPASLSQSARSGPSGEGSPPTPTRRNGEDPGGGEEKPPPAFLSAPARTRQPCPPPPATAPSPPPPPSLLPAPRNWKAGRCPKRPKWNKGFRCPKSLPPALSCPGFPGVAEEGGFPLLGRLLRGGETQPRTRLPLPSRLPPLQVAGPPSCPPPREPPAPRSKRGARGSPLALQPPGLPHPQPKPPRKPPDPPSHGRSPLQRLALSCSVEEEEPEGLMGSGVSPAMGSLSGQRLVENVAFFAFGLKQFDWFPTSFPPDSIVWSFIWLP
ncbi:proline-rich protein HaeIII subfamily 1-like [Pituophis catenifer annectens]|uniref:proline-rich protein HaeIII subfamily 1-like n=1 Tax=Pituophis catenifer annectens TaxID=94852 RepID=UPI00399616FD